MLAVGTLAISSLVFAAPAAQAILPSPASYPSGTYANVPETSITGTGWTECWSSTYGSYESIDTVLDGCTGDYLVLAGGPVGADTFTVAAAGPRSAVLAVTAPNATTPANGAYWYYNGASMGFAPIAQIYQSSAEIVDVGGGQDSPDVNTGGW